MKYPDLASFKCFDKSSTYTVNNRGDKIPPCLTLFETVKKLNVYWPHLINAHSLSTISKHKHSKNQQRNFTNNKLANKLPVLYTIERLRGI